MASTSTTPSSPSSAKQPSANFTSPRRQNKSSAPSSPPRPRSSPSMATAAVEYSPNPAHFSPEFAHLHRALHTPQTWTPSTGVQQNVPHAGFAALETRPNIYPRIAGQTVSPPHSRPSTSPSSFCYRHDPDTRCRRQGDGPTMDNLQKELSSLSPSEQQGINYAWSLFSTAPSRQRELMLKGMLAQCCFPQLSFVSASVRDLLKIDFLSALPPELGLRILCFLDPASLCKSAQVSRNWKELADDDAVWHRMCEQHIDRKCTKCGWGLPLLDRQRLRTEKRLQQLRLNGHFDQNARRIDKPTIRAPAISDTENPYNSAAYMSDDSEDNEVDGTVKADGKKRSHGNLSSSYNPSSKKVCTPTHNYGTDQSFFQPSLRPWKDIYRDRFRVGTNWKYGRSSLKIFKGHTDSVMCLSFDDSLLATGSYDSTIKIWDLETGEVLRTLTGHTMGVKCLRFDQSKLVSGSLDGTVKMWNMKTGKNIRTFPGHDGAVSSVDFDGMILASGSEDKTIRVRNFMTCSRVVLRGHTDWVNSVKVHAASQTLFSASDDNTVRMWDLEATRCLRVFAEHVSPVQQVLHLPLDFELGHMEEACDEDMQDQASPRAMRTIRLSTSADRSSPPRYLLSASLDSTLKLWDVETGRCVRTFFGHMEGVLGLAADTLRAVSSANDGVVKIWDPRTGRCERTVTEHTASVTCVAINDRRMVTGSEDHEIRVYDFGH